MQIGDLQELNGSKERFRAGPVVKNKRPRVSDHFFNLTLILIRCIQQLCGNNATGQLQELKDLTRLVKVVYTILYSSGASLLQA